MKLTKQAIQEFAEIYKEEFGEKISIDEAEKLGANLINLVKVIYKPVLKSLTVSRKR